MFSFFYPITPPMKWYFKYPLFAVVAVICVTWLYPSVACWLVAIFVAGAVGIYEVMEGNDATKSKGA